MSEFKRKSKEELMRMSVDEFIDYMSQWDSFTEAQYSKAVVGSVATPVFISIEEARAYYGSISIEEFENKYFKRDII